MKLIELIPVHILSQRDEVHLNIRRELMSARDASGQREQLLLQLRTELEARDARIGELESFLTALRTELSSRDELVTKLRIEIRDTSERNQRFAIEV